MSAAAERRQVVLATGNAGKLREVRALLAGLCEVVGLDAFPEVSLPEEGDDYRDNAIEKARAAARETGLPALGDDSGLEVDALDGGPGPRSARYGGASLDAAGRNARLLAALSRVTPEARGARFYCVAAVAGPDGALETAEGECRGRILEAPRGEAGFGYDPIFQPEGHDASMAELPEAEKNRLSHRGRAIAALRPALERVLAAAARSAAP
ncbi:MAG TPA: RdgB/HAM1 family non-canonical purine NTP pyrophosphatase [Myxococcota bacterium]|nr:RdgB/HAM1 family non-canonical purine NTP pyrophosphatase [Myxococcota bacterium]